MKKFSFLLLFIGFCLALAGFSIVVTFENHTAIANLSNTYTLNYSFDKVKRVLVQTDVLEEMVAYEQGQILEKNWKNLTFSGKRPLIDGVDVDGSLEILVIRQDPDLGRALMRFNQTIHLDKYKINSETSLVDPVSYLKKLTTIMEIIPDGNNTVVKTSVSLQYQRRIPKNMIEEVNRRLNQSAQQMLSNNKEVITMLVKKYADKLFVLPLKLKKE